jgi:hypothetical protein
MRRAIYGKLRPNQKKIGGVFRDPHSRFSVGEQKTKIKGYGREKANAVQASHPDRIRTWFPALLVTAWRRNDRFSPTALQRSAAFAEACCRFVILRSRTCKLCGGQRPFPAPRSRVGEEAATPGQPVALARVFWKSPGDSPSRITGCRWLCRNHSASSGNITFRCTHSYPDCCTSQHKKLVLLCRSCGG